MVLTESVLRALPKVSEEKIAPQETCKEENGLLEDPVEKIAIKQPKGDLSVEPEIAEVDPRKDKKGRLPVDAISPYLTIEPSLASDWLEVAWNELHIKERVGAGMSFFHMIFLVCNTFSDVTP